MISSVYFFRIILTSYLLLVFILISVKRAPKQYKSYQKQNISDSDKSNSTSANNNTEETEYQGYDVINESQNGTENYRINIKDVIVIWAPADVLLAATTFLTPQLLTSSIFENNESVAEHQSDQWFTDIFENNSHNYSLSSKPIDKPVLSAKTELTDIESKR